MERAVSPTGSANLRRQQIWAIAATGLIILCALVWLGLEIPRGILTQGDELRTAERSREMLLTRQPWVINFNFQHSFQKPPLQYWLTALTLPRFENRTLAIRIWTLMFGALTMIALTWLVYLVDPARPWLIPFTIALLVSRPRFSVEASQAQLDIGLAFFTTIAIAFAQLARTRPAWWLAVAIACALGSLQKVPLIFLIWLVIVLVRLASSVDRPRLRTKWLAGSFALAIAATLAWWVVQIAKYKMAPGAVLYEEFARWYGPEHVGNWPFPGTHMRLGTVAWIGGGALILIVCSILLLKVQPLSSAAREIAISCLGVIALTLVLRLRSVRYLVPMVPSFCIVVSLILAHFLAKGGTIRRRAAIVFAIILVSGFAQAKVEMRLREKNVSDEKIVAETLGTLQQSEARTLLVGAKPIGTDLSLDAFYLFHGNLHYPVAARTLNEIQRLRPDPPVRGVCVERDFPVIQQIYPNVQAQFRRAQFIIWEVNTR